MRVLKSRPVYPHRLHATALMSGKSSHGTFRNRRREGDASAGGGFRVFVTVIGLAVLVAVILMAAALKKLRDEHIKLSGLVADDLEVRRQGDPAGRQLLDARIAALESKITDRDVGESGSADAKLEKRLLIRSLAILLHQHGAGSSEISTLIGGFSESERKQFMAELATIDEGAGHDEARHHLV